MSDRAKSEGVIHEENFLYESSFVEADPENKIIENFIKPVDALAKYKKIPLQDLLPVRGRKLLRRETKFRNQNDVIKHSHQL